MQKFRITYTSLQEAEVWASSAIEADSIAQTFPNFYANLQVIPLFDFPFNTGQQIYSFDDGKIKKGIVTDINFLDEDTVKVFVRFNNEPTAKMFYWPEETSNLKSSVNEVLEEIGEGLPQNEIPALPPPPTGLFATNITTTSLTIHWLSVAGALSYNIYKDGKSYLYRAEASGARIRNLEPGKSYSFEITANSLAGETARSSPLIIETVPSAPSIPQDLQVADLRDTTLTLSWSPSTDASYYRVYINGDLQLDMLETLSANIEDLFPNTLYEIKVGAVNPGGETFSTPIEITTLPPLPDIVSGLGVSFPNAITTQVTWEHSIHATKYQVILNEEEPVFVTSNIIELYNLNVGEHTVSVLAMNDSGSALEETTLVFNLGEID